MKRSLEGDLARLEKLAFKRRQRCGRPVAEFHRLRESIELFGECERMWNVYDWLMAPLTLWPIDFEGLACHTLDVVQGKADLDKPFKLLLRLVSKPPPFCLLTQGGATASLTLGYDVTAPTGRGVLQRLAK
jgi:hypothetical protein